MVTDLNKSVKSFFDNYSLEKITVNNVKEYFKNINEQNDYGGILHACVHNKFNEKKVLKLMEILMKLGIDVNLCPKLTGYSFIHLALYGYTENNKDYSYSTDFIVKLINLAKKYNFDVNLVDNDKDTIIHTAMASEAYDGKIEPLIDALGEEFNIEAKDNNSDDIYQALLKYKQAYWGKRLAGEENIIKNIIEKGRYTIDEINKILDDRIKLLDKTFNSLDINQIIKNYKTIKISIDELEKYITIRKKILDEESIYDTKKNEFINKIKTIINTYIETISDNLNLDILDNLINILQELSYEKELKKVQNLKKETLKKLEEEKKIFLKTIQNLKKEILTCNTLNKLNVKEQEIKNMQDKRIINELSNDLEQSKEKFIKQIKSIKEVIALIEITINWISHQPLYNIELKKDNENIDFNELTIKELNNINKTKINYLESLKRQILLCVNTQVKDIIISMALLEENMIFTKNQITNSIIEVINNDDNPKIKKKTSNKKRV